ncbi:hypothetical protein DVH26_32860 [Paenibacillus sp. H1-7]|uniref:hypothetical protein n=1 Tax=Paenibacillus sp. H1-7 TaxID=2282849 RepID=UPI001EF8E9EA|nr:hypothetical protein [Paenibacillus sp. H1-7]ULL18809.1 hypothetical protein DVH26_32860 [Paenibacillus sp. H1-7]
MFGFMLFLHLTGLFVWLGSLLAVIVVLPLLQKQTSPDTGGFVMKRLIRVFSWLSHPSAVVVLGSGVYMIVQMGIGSEKPLWLNAMEKGGGMIIVLALLVTGILSGNVKKRLDQGHHQAAAVPLSGYITTLSVFMVLIVSIVFIVSMKL